MSDYLDAAHEKVAYQDHNEKEAQFIEEKMIYNTFGFISAYLRLSL